MRSARPRAARCRRLLASARSILAGAFLVAMSTFQGEFDFGVPQFALALHPTLIMLAAGIALVTARIRIGRGGAIGALLGYLAIRGLLAFLIGPLFGEITPHFPPYVAEALVVEAVGLPLPARPRRRRAADHLRRPRRPRHRHDRPRRRVGLVARLDRQPVAGLPLPRGSDHRPDRRPRRRRDRRLHRPLPDSGGGARGSGCPEPRSPSPPSRRSAWSPS